MRGAIPFLLLIAGIIMLAMSGPISSGPVSWSQPQDNQIREIMVTRVIDGDTVVADICAAEIGEMSMWLREVRLRLKDVRAYEIDSKDAKEREVALVEQAALRKLCLDGPITAKIYKHGTFGRHDADLFNQSGCINNHMLAYPQGGR